MEREYIKVKRPTSPFPSDNNLLRDLDNEFWKEWIFFHLLSFYEKCNRIEITQLIEDEKAKTNPRVERTIARYIRKWLNNNHSFSFHFKAFGENTNDEEIEGYYDITIHNTYWQNGDFHFECKNLNKKQDLINKYVFYDTYKDIPPIYDGGVYRYFNGKYSQNQFFGGMLGFILEGDIQTIKAKIINKMSTCFDVSPEGDLLSIEDNTIFENNFTFNSTHKRNNQEFLIHHILFKLD